MALKHNITIDQGASFIMTFVVTDGDDEPIDYSSAVLTAMMRKHHESTHSFPFVVTGNADGNVVLMMSAEDTADLEPGRYIYDVIAQLETDISRVVEGIVSVTPGVSK